MFERKVFNRMLERQQEASAGAAPRPALVLRGPRGVGKTTLADRLGREAFRAFVRVGLDEEAGREVEDMKRLLGLLADGRIDPDGFLAALSFVLRTELPSRESLLILD